MQGIGREEERAAGRCKAPLIVSLHLGLRCIFSALRTLSPFIPSLPGSPEALLAPKPWIGPAIRFLSPFSPLRNLVAPFISTYAMKLRQRTSAQLAAMVEPSDDGSDPLWAPCPPGERVRPPEIIAKEQRNRSKTDLIEKALRTEGSLVDLLGADSLVAVRSTCTAFRDLVDSTGRLSSAQFSVFPSGRGCDLLGAWAAPSRLTSCTRSLLIRGKMPAALAQRVLSVLTSDQRPPISKLELEESSDTADNLLTAPLDELRELRLNHIILKSRYLKKMMGIPLLVV